METMLRNISILIFLLAERINTVKSIELNFNPYKYYDEREIDWRVIEINKLKKDVFYRSQKSLYKAFQEEEMIVTLDDSLNDTTNIKAKLSAKLIYFMTNHYNPIKFTEREFKMESPFIISKENKDLLTNLELNQYESKEININLSIKDKIDSAEIVDIFSDTSEVIPVICSDYTQIQQIDSSCSSKQIKTEDPMDPLSLKFRFIANKDGQFKYNLYILTVLNEKINIVVTVVGNYVVKKHPHFNLYYSKNIFRISLDKNNFEYLWLKNLKSATVNIASLQGYGTHLHLNYPKKFKQSEFSALNINSKLRQRIKNSNLNYWLIPSNDERPIIEIEFNQASREYINKSGLPMEVFMSTLQNNVLKIIVDQKPLILSFSVFFAPDYKFWEHDLINCGIFTTKNTWHEIPIFASSKTPLPMFLQNVEVEINDDDFEVNVATNYKYGIPLPFENQRMKLLNLLVKYNGNQNFAVIRGKLKASIDIYNTIYEEILNFHGVFYRDIFSVSTKSRYNLVQKSQEKFSIYLTQETNSIIRLDQILLIEDKSFEEKVTIKGYPIDLLKPGIEYKLYDVDFSNLPDIHDRTKAVYVIKIKALENIFTLKIDFPIETLLCTSIPNFKEKDFKDCKEEQELIFPFFKSNRLLLKKEIYVKNPNIGSVVFHRIKARNFNLGFENSIHIRLISKNQQLKDLNEEMNYSYQINRPLTIMFPSLVLEELDMIQLIIEIKIPSDFVFEKELTSFKSLLLLYNKKGDEYVVNLEYEYIKGELKFYPLIFKEEILFPTGSKNIVLGAKSSYEKPIVIDIPKKFGPSKDILELRTFNRVIKPGFNQSIMEFKIDPALLKNYENHSVTQVLFGKRGLCLAELEAFHNNNLILNSLMKSSNNTISASIAIDNSINENIEIKLEGQIKIANFLGNRDTAGNLNLGFVSDTYKSEHELILQNPFNVPIELELMIAPKAFINMDLLEKEVLASLKNDETKKRGTICMKNDNMPLETLQYYAHTIYSKHLEYVKELKPRNHQKALKFACFMTPKNETETEMILFKIQTFNNYFFEFIQDRDKNNLFKKKVVLFTDFDEYNEYKRKEKKIEHKWDFVYEFKNKFFSFFKSYFTEETKKQAKDIKKKKIPDSTEYHETSHIKELKTYTKNKQIFLNDNVLNQKFILAPDTSLKLTNAILFDPLKEKINDFNNDIVLMIKNNITKLEVKNIEFKKYQSLLKAYEGGGRPVIDNNLLFHIFKKDQEEEIFKTSENDYDFNVLTRYFIFHNKGKQNIFIKKIEILNKGKIEKCLEVLNFEPLILMPAEEFYVRIIFFPCRKMLENFDVDLIVYDEIDKWTFKLKIIFDYYHIRNIEHRNNGVRILYTFLIVVVIQAFLMLKTFIQNYIKKKRYTLKIKVKLPKFITESSLEEKLKIHKAEITLKTIKILQKLNHSLNLRTIRKNSESENTKEFNFNNGILSKILSGNEEILKNYNYNKNVFTSIPNNHLDMSGISIEKLYKLLQNPKSRSNSGSEEEICEKLNLINNTDVYEGGEDDLSSKNKFGSIGDNSFSGFQSSLNHDISFTKPTVNKRKEKSVNPNEFINSFIISQQLKDNSNLFEGDEEEEDEDDNENNSSNDSSFLDLHNAFGVFPLGKKKTQISKISATSKEYVKPTGLYKKILEQQQQNIQKQKTNTNETMKRDSKVRRNSDLTK